MALKIGKTEDHQITISNLDADARAFKLCGWWQ